MICAVFCVVLSAADADVDDAGSGCAAVAATVQNAEHACRAAACLWLTVPAVLTLPLAARQWQPPGDARKRSYSPCMEVSLLLSSVCLPIFHTADKLYATALQRCCTLGLAYEPVSALAMASEKL